MTPPKNLQVFLYILMRDHLVPGAVEKILRDHVAKAEEQGGAVAFCNAHLAAYAGELAYRLCPSELPSGWSIAPDGSFENSLFTLSQGTLGWMLRSKADGTPVAGGFDTAGAAIEYIGGIR